MKNVYGIKIKVLICLLIGIFVIDGCGRKDIPLDETIDYYSNEENSTSPKKTEDTTEIGEDNGESTEDLPKTLEVPVNTKAEEVHYHGEDGIEPGRAMRRCRSDGENIYLVYGNSDLYAMTIGADEHRKLNIDNPEELDICNIAMDLYGRIHLLTSHNGDEWFIWRLDEDLLIDKVMDISEYFTTKQLPGWFLIDKDGTYYIQWANSNRDGMVLDGEGVIKDRFTPGSLGTGWIYQASVGKDGKIYLVHSEYGEKLEIGELDIENHTIKKGDTSLCFSGEETFSVMAAGTDTNLLLFSPYSGGWACDTERGILENRVPLTDIGLDSDMEFCPLAFLADGRLLLLRWIEKDYYFKYIPVGK